MTRLRYFHFKFHLKVTVKRCPFHFSKFIPFELTLRERRLTETFNDHLVDLYAECVRRIHPVPSSILRQTSNTPGRSNFKVLYSSKYSFDILLGENLLNGARNAFFKVTQQCEPWVSSCSPSLNAQLSFKHAALTSYGGNV